MTHLWILAVIAVLCAPVIQSSNILVFLPSPWKSHLVSFQPLFLELAHRGHNVTVVSQFAVKNPPLNYTQVILEYEMDLASFIDDVFQKRNDNVFFLEEVHLRAVIAVKMTEMYISSPAVQKFVTEDQSQFDLVIVESFYQECTVAMGHKYGAPVINLVPLAPWIPQSRYAANPMDFSYIKDFKLVSGKSIDFKNRVLNTFYGLYGLIAEPLLYIPKLENMMNRYFQYPGYENRPTLTEMLKNISLNLIDSDVMVLSPRPYVPSFIEVPGIHLRPTNAMSEKLHDFMDKANAGVVYFNFGTLLNVASLPKATLQILFNVLGRLEQKVVFKWTGNDTQAFPSNFYVDSWLPQLEILRHPNCRLFITHGGVHGLLETIDAGIPFIGFPVFGDQFQNMRSGCENGFGVMGQIFELSEETFERDVKTVLTDQKFTDNAKRMSSIFHDRPMSTIDKAVYWVEYVIRHKGAHHLRSPAVDLKWYQFYLLDVIAFIISVLLLFVFLCYFIIKKIMRLILSLLCTQKKVKSS